MKELENVSGTPVSTKVTPPVVPTPVSTKVTPPVAPMPVSTKVTPPVAPIVATPVSTKVTPLATATPTTPNWNEQKSKLKAKFATLTDADLHFEADKKEEMLTKVQTKLGKTKEEFQKIIANL